MPIAFTTTLIAATTLGAAAYAAVCGLVAQRFTTARRRSPQATAGLVPVQFPSRDGRALIHGCYLAPREPRGAVVFVHGVNGCRGDELKASTAGLAQSLAEAGLAVLMIDLRGHGSSSRARLTYGERERYDVLGAVDWLRQRGHQRIGALGASMGAASALMAAAEEPAIAALVADSPFADFAQMIQRQFSALSGLPVWFLPGALLIGRLLTGVDLTRVRPIGRAGALAGRAVLVIHSEGDGFVPVEDGRAIAQAIGAEIWTTATPGHIGSYAGLPAAYTERVVGFFERHLLGPVSQP